MTPSFERDVPIGSITLDCGARLEGVVQRVTAYGERSADDANVALVLHALTGSSRVASWWSDVVGPGKAIDTNRTYAIGINALGGCYGSTGPATTSGPFPPITPRDIVRAQIAALRELGMTRIATAIGGSLGGMQAVEWALQREIPVEHAVVVGAYDYFSAMGIALNAIAREAVRNGGPGDRAGIKLARKIAMLTYKSEALLAERYGRKPDRGGGDPYRDVAGRFDVEGYLDHQGDIFASRMDDGAYLALTRAMDLFDTRDRSIESPAPAMTFVGISSDWLFLPQYVRAAAERFAAAGADSVYVELESNHGHDAFLAEPATLTALIAPRLRAFAPVG